MLRGRSGWEGDMEAGDGRGGEGLGGGSLRWEERRAGKVFAKDCDYVHRTVSRIRAEDQLPAPYRQPFCPVHDVIKPKQCS